ncbi:hypothetical protein GCM10025868_27970 [Angustibacter aerolatus]|uniref:ABC-2 type transporter domain-containing protein n=1 Tax=Angustibacter aerolatus TaxID=1162965 RepID=A0ABQ6JIG6_9ACTN|nr:hypothetical protein [Angustibacter aerolatus]GMA87547.1 hypothetical protein GCM10025868_27970 [Angustibacter aerolatus]
MVLAGLAAAGLTTLVRHTGGLLGVLFGYTVLVETIVNIVGTERGWTRWLVSQNLAAVLLPGGNTIYVRYDETGAGHDVTIHLSHLQGFAYLAALTAAALLVGSLVLRRRDL